MRPEILAGMFEIARLGRRRTVGTTVAPLRVRLVSVTQSIDGELGWDDDARDTNGSGRVERTSIVLDPLVDERVIRTDANGRADRAGHQEIAAVEGDDAPARLFVQA
jgi:hypothetical protein